ncbi:glycosyltransferase [Nitrosococcus wardiae]|uniref:Glycosyltransferase family 4 protein n=1 Tax=Nitrosococcus wardiae TaxID=1814290 RepID=A0A4P7C6F0_9GAMM|nr:glycosyltransferase [Nitrosococcus wardiae]QBQ56502.1 glycosyltransferase family 4 protein [Nitrosococcus wardiae]
MLPTPRLVVFTTLFPHPGQPGMGLFIRERMFRVGQTLPVVVVAPVPWFPFQGLIRYLKPHFRPPAPRYEQQQGFEVYHPRFFSVPGRFKTLDGLFLALSSFVVLRRLKQHYDFEVLDAHFAYPDGYAATLLGRWLKVPVTITMRGTESRLANDPQFRRLLCLALQRAQRIFCVSESLKRLAITLGVREEKIQVVPNGVDTGKFAPISKEKARQKLGLPLQAPVLVTVGALVERKGFHRVIELMPQLRQEFPELIYLVVGGSSPEGDWRKKLQQQAEALGLQERVRFLGQFSPEELKVPLSAADVFVLATRNEGWANVLLEAMACGLPVVTTDVGGNAEVISTSNLGEVIPFGDAAALESALAGALRKSWERAKLIAYAKGNSWDLRVATLVQAFQKLVCTHANESTLKVKNARSIRS